MKNLSQTMWTLIGQCVSIGAVFYCGASLWASRFPVRSSSPVTIPYEQQTPAAVYPPPSITPSSTPEDDQVIETTLFPTSFFSDSPQDGLPQHNTLSHKIPPNTSDVPQGLWEAIFRNFHTPGDQAVVAAIAWRESRWKADCRGDGGHSWGAFQIHDRWHAEEVASMGSDWSDYETNLQAFRAVIEKQQQWRKGRDDWRGILSYYNEGTNWDSPKGQLYADSVLRKAGQIIAHFRRGGASA